MGPDARLAERRFARGCRAFAICDGGQVRAYGWLSSGPEWIGEARAAIRPRPGEAYIWNCVTLPAHRRRGLFRALVAGVTARLAAEGTTRVWIAGVDGTAEKAIAGLGYQPVARLAVRRLGPFRWLSVTGTPAPLRYRRLDRARGPVH